MVIVSPPRVSSTSAVDDAETSHESSLIVLLMRSSSQQAGLDHWRGRTTSNLTREEVEASAVASAAADEVDVNESPEDADDVHEPAEDEDDVHESAEDEDDVQEPPEEVRDGDPSVPELANMTLPDDVLEKLGALNLNETAADEVQGQLEMLNRDEIAVHKKCDRYVDHKIFCDCTIFL